MAVLAVAMAVSMLVTFLPSALAFSVRGDDLVKDCGEALKDFQEVLCSPSIDIIQLRLHPLNHLFFTCITHLLDIGLHFLTFGLYLRLDFLALSFTICF